MFFGVVFVLYFQTTSCNQTAFFPIDNMHFYTPYREIRIASPSINMQLVYFIKSSHTRQTGKALFTRRKGNPGARVTLAPFFFFYTTCLQGR